MKPAVDFRARVEELRTLASSRPRPQDRAIVMAALHSKWEGLQSVAVQTLGSWGDRESVAALREFWLKTQDCKNGWSIRSVISTALAKGVKKEDASWLLDLYFDGHSRWDLDLAPAVCQLPVVAVRGRIMQESHSDNTLRRRAALGVASCLPEPEYHALLKRFSSDQNPEISSSARYLERYFASKEKG